MAKLSFRRRQFLILLILALVPLGIAAGLSVVAGRNFVIERTTQQLETVADLETVQVEEWLEEGREVAALVARLEAFRVDLAQPVASDNKQIQMAMEAIQEVFPNVQFVSLLHPESGQVLLSTEPTQLGRIRQNEAYFQAGQTSLSSGPVHYSIGREAPVVITSAPVQNAQGELLAVVTVEMNLTKLQEILNERAGLGETGRAYLVEEFGFYVTQPYDNLGGPLRKVAHSEGVSHALAGENGSDVYLNPLGVSVLGVYRWLPETRLGLLVEVEEAELTIEILRLWQRVALLTLGLLIVAIVFARALTNWLVTPLEQIANAAHKLQHGDLGYRSSQSGPDEIGQLALAFNNMADSVQQSQKTLEERVAQRTAELQVTNQQLGGEIT